MAFDPVLIVCLIAHESVFIHHKTRKQNSSTDCKQTYLLKL